MADQRRLGLGPDPAPDPVTTHQHDEAAAGVHRLLQPLEPEIPLADALVVLEHGDPALFQLAAQDRRRLAVVAAVAQKDVVVVRHPADLPVRKSAYSAITR